MAFGFFRRRQKMVIIIMVVLMVSFLVGYQGFEMFFQRNKNPLIGRMGKEEIKIKRSQWEEASQDVQVLGKLSEQSPALAPTFLALRRANRDNEHDISMAFALLLAEARMAKIRVTENDVNEFIDRFVRAAGQKDQASFYQTMRDRRDGGLSKQAIIWAVERWLTINKNFEANQISVPPSQPELQLWYRDTQEKIAVRMVRLKASDFVGKVKEDPTNSELGVLFEQYRKNLEGEAVGGDSAGFGFGYAQPDRASVQYLMLKDDAVYRGSRPNEEDIKQDYLDNKAQYDRLKKQLSDLKDEIALKLESREVKRHIDAVLAEVEKIVAEKIAAEKSTQTVPVNVYEQARSEMMLSAEAELGKKLKDVILDGTLEQVIDRLAQKAGLNAIVFPYDLPGEIKIDPELRVTLNEEGTITLGEALQKITDKVLGPQASSAPAKAGTKIEWRTCKGFDKAIFPVGPGNLELFPLQTGETGLKNGREMSEDPAIGNANSGGRRGGISLLELVFTSPAFRTENASTLTMGQPGHRMFLNNQDRSRRRELEQPTLLWRLANAKKNYVPEAAELNTNAELRAKVIQDWKIRKAHGLALEEARKIEEVAKAQGLEKAVKQFNLKMQETEPFARKVLLPFRELQRQRLLQNVNLEAMRIGFERGKALTQEEYEVLLRVNAIPEKLAQLLNERPLMVVRGDPKIELGSRGWNELSMQQFIDAAFVLVPQNVEPPYKGKPPVHVAELRLLHEVAVLERADFVPAVIGEYQGVLPTRGLTATMMAALINDQQKWDQENAWFHLGSENEDERIPNITRRTEYKKEKDQ